MAGENEDEVRRLKKQRSRSIAIALSLGVMVVLFYAAAMVRVMNQMPIGHQ